MKYWTLILALLFIASSETRAQRVLFVLTSNDELGNTGENTGFYLSEAAHPWYELHEAGIEVDFMSPEGGMPPVTGFKLDDPVNRLFWENEEVQKKLQNSMKPEEVEPGKYDAIHFVGGHGTMWDFPENEKIAEIAARIYENQGVVAAVCHGPAGLVNLKLSDGSYLVDGKKVAAFTNEEEKVKDLDQVVPFLLADKLEERGAIHIPAPTWQENVVVSGRLITGQNPASAGKLGRELVKQIRDR
ncbi:MAG: type 1 glutamine amidotransferase domain-containing protein [Bacteroidota bacterium]|nr:type 1 glutamine amidotransferase domain-containing protein [Bacteroidota bacterium]